MVAEAEQRLLCATKVGKAGRGDAQMPLLQVREDAERVVEHEAHPLSAPIGRVGLRKDRAGGGADVILRESASGGLEKLSRSPVP